MNRKTYTMDEKTAILKKLKITPLNGMVNSRQAAAILSERAEQEVGEKHTYSDNAIRWRVKTKKLNVAAMMNNRLSLFDVNDIFLLDLEPHKWWSRRGKGKASNL